ncbi:lipoprotein insertase outer membrane protein LolB [Psychrobacter pygoscelis]|uniref:lipoprotein insertase outer membrane protein LolB n=1 Tax=Psychrobacter pygoscelis TaxID=2488563 RepID=UPI00103F2723|nr:lipoprotein insertase outer membrane protein LolB [Psychrobacter pygoscelis]
MRQSSLLQPTFIDTANNRYAQALRTLAFVALSAALVTASGCQSMHTKTQPLPSTTAPAPSANVLTPAKLDSFMISGKIGITTAATEQQAAQAGSAFYAWGQENERFVIELMGALGLGKTNISYDGQTATLVSEKTGTLSANSPDELLQKATGWQVPISQLPYWISGHPTPTDTGHQVDNSGRLVAAINGDWTASFSYDGDKTLPSKILARHDQGHKVVMTIIHQTPQPQ